MKLAVILLACLPFVFCAPEKRLVFDGITTFDVTHLKQTLQTMVNVLGSDTTEGACEKECHTLLTDPSSLLHHSCGLICHGFQDLVLHFQLSPHTTSA
ncbi:hypothetical protein ACJMK2_023419 [Sinanodonta woodiana]|uniref:Uncharacterized protein n=1 Tax=Sinanodonta woodiana TaxID=1069815 RepID=A0ABD3T4V7_SINWO